MIRDEALESGTMADADEPIRSKGRTRWAPPLSANEECELAARIKGGDQAARRRLILTNLRIVVDIARRYAGRKLPMDDLVQEGNLGLIRASADFDPMVHGCRFYTYAGIWIRAFIRKALVANDSIIRVPNHAFRRHQERRPETATAGADDPGLEGAEDDAEEPKAAPRRGRSVEPAPARCEASASSDAAVDFVPLFDAIVDPRQPEQEAAEQERRLALDLALRRLNPVEAWVLRERYGLGLKIAEEGRWASSRPTAPRRDRKGEKTDPTETCRSYFHRTYPEMRRDCGLSYYRIRQVEVTALEKLREALHA